MPRNVRGIFLNFFRLLGNFHGTKKFDRYQMVTLLDHDDENIPVSGQRTEKTAPALVSGYVQPN